MRARILTTSTSGFYGQLLKGFAIYRRALARELALDVEIEPYASLAELAQRLRNAGESVCAVVPHFSDPPDALAEALAAARDGSPRALVLLDGHDQTSTPHFPVLPHVDRYVKSKALADRTAYQRELRGGYVFADFYSRTHDFDLQGWHFGSIPDPALVDRIVAGWNFGVTRRCRWLCRLARLAPAPLPRRPIDVNARISLADPDEKWEWYQDYRTHCRRAVAEASRGRRVTGEDRVGTGRYLAELLRSRLVFSPFGWGEVCLRDYEAVAAGALLVKPDMSHVETSPDIYVSGRTYVPVRWDLADLAEKVAHYLDHPDEAEAIARAGREALARYFEAGGFVADVKRTLLPPR